MKSPKSESAGHDQEHNGENAPRNTAIASGLLLILSFRYPLCQGREDRRFLLRRRFGQGGFGGRHEVGNGLVFVHTQIAGVTHDMLIMREETFGPVLPVASFETDEQAIQLANDSEFGLAASVWTRDRRRGEALARKINAGTVMVNDVLSCFGMSEAPHGGMKSSGIGRTHGRFGMEEMVRAKYLDIDLMPGMKKIWWYGYGESFVRQMEGFVDLLFARRLGKRLIGGVRSGGVVRKEKRL